MLYPESHIISKSARYAEFFIQREVPAEFVFHDLLHTRQVVQSVGLIAEAYGDKLDERSREILLIAAWFHDTGYYQGKEKHEDHSCKIALEFLSEHSYPKEHISVVCDLIISTTYPHQPKSFLERIICDADLSHLGSEQYWTACNRLRQELLLSQTLIMEDVNWIEFELDFLRNHHFHSPIARQLFGEQKKRNIQFLEKRYRAAKPRSFESVDELLENDLRRHQVKNPKKAILPKKTATPTNLIPDFNIDKRISSPPPSVEFSEELHLKLARHASYFLVALALVLVGGAALLFPRLSNDPGIILPASLFFLGGLTAALLTGYATKLGVSDEFKWQGAEEVGELLRKKYSYLRMSYLVFGITLVLTLLYFLFP